MSKIIIKQFDTVIYPRQIWIAAGGTRGDIAENFKDDEGDPFYVSQERIKNSEALAFSVHDKDKNCCGSLVWFHDPERMNFVISPTKACTQRILSYQILESVLTLTMTKRKRTLQASLQTA